MHLTGKTITRNVEPSGIDNVEAKNQDNEGDKTPGVPKTPRSFECRTCPYRRALAAAGSSDVLSLSCRCPVPNSLLQLRAVPNLFAPSHELHLKRRVALSIVLPTAFGGVVRCALVGPIKLHIFAP